MSIEDQTLDRKSPPYAPGSHEDADGLACDCVGVAKPGGCVILLGAKDGQDEPPIGQKVPENFPDWLRKPLAHTAVNIGVAIGKVTAENWVNWSKKGKSATKA